MDSIRKDVRDLITVNEKIQSALLQGDALTNDEASIVRMCATELLSRVSDTHSTHESHGEMRR
ncbi:MAG TPA: hypothetical protein VJ746_11875 [Nitrospira sp.]|nr:hypothetical protein [Nitrospira sp.]